MSQLEVNGLTIREEVQGEGEPLLLIPYTPADPACYAFLAQIDGIVARDASAVLSEIDVPTPITFGARDLGCSTRFAEPLMNGIAGSELVVFDHLSHAGLHGDPETSTERRSTSCCASARDLGCAIGVIESVLAV